MEASIPQRLVPWLYTSLFRVLPEDRSLSFRPHSRVICRGVGDDAFVGLRQEPGSTGPLPRVAAPP